MLKNFTIKQKFLSLLAFMLLVFVVSGSITFMEIRESQNLWNGYLSNIAKRQQLLMDIKAEFGYGGGIHHFKNLVLRANPKYAKQAQKKLKLVLNKIEQFLKLQNLSQNEKKALAQIKSIANRYKINVKTILNLQKKKFRIHDIDLAVRIDDTDAFKAFKVLNSEYLKLVKKTNQHINTSLSDSIITTTSSLTFSLFVLLFFSYSIGNSITSSLNKIVNFAKQIGKGNMAGELEVNSQDEIGLLASSMLQMRNNLQKTTVAKNYVDSIFQSLSEMLFILDFNGRIKTINEKAANLLGYKNEDLIDINIDIIIEEENEIFSKFHKITEEGYAKDIHAHCITKSQERIPVLITGTTMKDENGKTKAIIISAKDARDSKLLQELRDKQNQLIQSAKLASLGEMSAGLAHELNNPLSFVMGFNSRIKTKLTGNDKINKEELLKYVKDIAAGATRMKKIINHFREFSRQSEHHLEIININDIIESAFILVDQQLKSRSIEIEKKLCIENPKIKGDKIRLEQVFVNLLSNAKDAFHRKNKTQVKKIKTSSYIENNSIIIKFEDNGYGIDENNIKSIFDPFFTTKEVGKGTGLGLSISHGIIGEHKGEILVTSKEKEGTVFTVVLPIHQETKIPQEQDAA